MKIQFYISGIFAILIGVLLILDVNIYLGKAGYLSNDINTIIRFIGIGAILVIIGNFFKKDIYSKCPKCEETYGYSKLKEGFCPKCKIKTIDMEKYYDTK